jgi:hypothetical protein
LSAGYGAAQVMVTAPPGPLAQVQGAIGGRQLQLGRGWQPDGSGWQA